MLDKLSKALPMILLLSLLLLLPVNIAACKSSISITDLGTFGGTSSSASDVNDRGQVVGSYSNITGSYAFVWTAKDGKTDLAKLSATQRASSAMAINDKGQIVGTCTTMNPDYDPTLPPPLPPQYLSHAVLWTAKNTVISLEPSSGVESSVATDISSDGTVVGYTMIVYPPTPTRPYYSTGPGNAFVWTMKTGMKIIPIPLADFGAVASTASGINTKGQVVGSLQKLNVTTGLPILYRAFIWSAKDGTQLIPLPDGAPVDATSSASDINEKGQVTGIWSESLAVDAARHGFVWTAKDGMTELPILPGAAYGVPADINNNGRIVGSCTTPPPTPPPYYPPVFQRGFLWDAKNGIMELPPLPGDNASYARGISENGQVAGVSMQYTLMYNSTSGEYLGYTSNSTAVVWDTRGNNP